MIRNGIASPDQLTNHLSIYREHHELVMRDRMLERLHHVDEADDDLALGA